MKDILIKISYSGHNLLRVQHIHTHCNRGLSQINWDAARRVSVVDRHGGDGGCNISNGDAGNEIDGTEQSREERRMAKGRI